MSNAMKNIHASVAQLVVRCSPKAVAERSSRSACAKDYY